MQRKDILADISFGERIAEDEVGALASYFVETDEWKRILDGEIDIVYGNKGAGKSAIYSLLLSKEKELATRGIIVISAENPRGTPAFKDLVADPPTGEPEFRALWKLYFLCVIADHLRLKGISQYPASVVIAKLEEAGLLSPNISRQGIIRVAHDYVRRMLRLESVEGGLKLDPLTGMPGGLTAKITLREPSQAARDAGLVSADELILQIDEALGYVGQNIWVLIDRLDVAFAESSELESNALRALFRVYVDLLSLKCVSFKVFLRTDIWKRITTSGFREASHITRSITLSWDKTSLLNLVLRRALHNNMIRRFYNVQPDEILSDMEKQSGLFYRIFPDKVDTGPKKPTTLDWLISRTSDGTQNTAPRELIHLLASARAVQLKKLEMGYPEPPDENLFDRTALKEALPEVSTVRFSQTLCAEYPEMVEPLMRLKGAKTEQTPETLAEIWKISSEKALQVAEKLTEIGFFEKRLATGEPTFWVPFLYRSALTMVQGSAE